MAPKSSMMRIERENFTVVLTSICTLEHFKSLVQPQRDFPISTSSNNRQFLSYCNKIPGRHIIGYQTTKLMYKSCQTRFTFRFHTYMVDSNFKVFGIECKYLPKNKSTLDRLSLSLFVGFVFV